MTIGMDQLITSEIKSVLKVRFCSWSFMSAWNLLTLLGRHCPGWDTRSWEHLCIFMGIFFYMNWKLCYQSYSITVSIKCSCSPGLYNWLRGHPPGFQEICILFPVPCWIMDSPWVWISICKSGILIPNLFLEFMELNGWEVIYLIKQKWLVWKEIRGWLWFVPWCSDIIFNPTISAKTPVFQQSW